MKWTNFGLVLIFFFQIWDLVSVLVLFQNLKFFGHCHVVSMSRCPKLQLHQFTRPKMDSFKFLFLFFLFFSFQGVQFLDLRTFKTKKRFIEKKFSFWTCKNGARWWVGRWWTRQCKGRKLTKRKRPPSPPLPSTQQSSQ